jgi:hypothetical protein
VIGAARDILIILFEREVLLRRNHSFKNIIIGKKLSAKEVILPFNLWASPTVNFPPHSPHALKTQSPALLKPLSPNLATLHQLLALLLRSF